MAIYVDDLFYSDTAPIKGYWCHLSTDSTDLEELHNFAMMLGLRKAYFQFKDRRYPHYDLFESSTKEGLSRLRGKRSLAIRSGAIPVTGRLLMETCYNKKSGREKS